MGFEWDEEKAKASFKKHGVLFSTEAVSVFDDDLARGYCSPDFGSAGGGI